MNKLPLCLSSLLLAAWFCAGCAAPKKLTRLEDLSNNEAVAIARFHIIHNGKDLTQKSSILFDAPSTGVPKYVYQLDDSGFVVANLPVGKNHINYILHPDQLTQRHFRDGELSFDLPEAKKIYYIGDITMDWRGSGSSKNWAIAIITGAATGGLGALVTGPLAGGAAGQGRIAIGVESKPADAEAAFRQKFPTSQETIPSLLVVTPRDPKSKSLSAATEKKD